MKAFIIDTSTKKSFIALLHNKKIEKALFLSGYENLSHTIDASLEKLFSHWQVQDLDIIGCGIGPGSYTGMRIGIMIAKSFSYAHNIPLCSFSSLEPFLDPCVNSAAILDAKSGGIYFLDEKKEALLIELSKAENALKKYETLFSPEPDALKKRLPQLNILDKDPHLPALAEYVFEKWTLKEVFTHNSLSPLYLRTPK